MDQSVGAERQFVVLLEQVRSEVRMVAEGLVVLDQKVDRGFAGIRQEMATGTQDLQAAIKELSRDLREHVHSS